MPLQQDFFDTSWDMDFEEVEPVKMGFIGCGEMAQFAVLPAVHVARICIEAVCDLDEQRARSTADRFSKGNYYTDYRKMWDSEHLEAVSVQLQPGPSRNRIVKEALERGFHVLMPKPPATTLEECTELAEYADRYKRNLMVNFESRFSYGVRMARKILGTKSFGRLTQGHFSFCTGSYKDRLEYRHDKPYEDGVHAFILDFTPHHLDLARFLCGEVQEMSLYHHEWDGESANALSILFENGTIATMQLNSNRIWWRNYDRIELTGQGEYVILESLWNIRHYKRSENTFTENYRDERSAELTGDGNSFREFAASIREKREPVAGIRDVCATMELYQALYGAVRKNRTGVVFRRQHGIKR